MLGEEKISGRQAVNLIITTLLSGSIIVTSAIHKQANRDSWLAILLSTALALLAGTVIAALGRRFPDQTIIQYGRQLFGRLPGMALGLLFVVLFLYMSILITRWVTELLITMFMPDTPLVVFAISFVGVCAYGVRHGLDVLARTNDIFLPVALALLFFILISNSPDMKIQNFFPVLEEGVMPVLKGALPQAAILAQSIIMVMLTPFLNKPREVKGVIFRGVITTGLLALLIMVSSISVLGNRTDRTMFVLLLLSRQINIGEVIERVEPFVLLLWLSIGVTSLGIFFFCTVLATAQTFNLKEYKALVLPAGVLIITLSILLWEHNIEFMVQIVQVLPPFLLALEAGLPLLLLVVAYLRGIGGVGK